MDRLQEALEFATNAHGGQVRKYTFEPYINHPIEVMNIIRSVPHTEDMLIAALNHDVFEDCGVKLYDIKKKFGWQVMCYVNDLSDVSKPEDGNREARKTLDRQWIAESSPESKTIKLADLISNSKSICEHDKDFAKV